MPLSKMSKSLLPDSYVAAIGKVIVNFQHLEFTVVRLIWVMAATDQEIGQRVTACVPFSQLCELLKSVFLYSVKDPSFVQKFQRLMTRMGEVTQLRNKVVHSWWFADIESGTPSRLKPKRKGSPKAVESFYDSEEIDYDDLSRSISDLADEFRKFIDELYEAKLIRTKPGLSLESLR
jgi:hypothetical protein